jgi:hypothetical protein
MARSNTNPFSKAQVRRMIDECLDLANVNQPWPPDKAIAITASTRFFHSFSKNGRIQRAWHISGATIFTPWSVGKITEVMNRIRSKGYGVSIVVIGEIELDDEPPTQEEIETVYERSIQL